jgi:hypothetical protein
VTSGLAGYILNPKDSPNAKKRKRGLRKYSDVIDTRSMSSSKAKTKLLSKATIHYY